MIGMATFPNKQAISTIKIVKMRIIASWTDELMMQAVVIIWQ